MASKVKKSMAEIAVEKAKVFAIANNPHHKPVKGLSQNGDGKYHEQLWNFYVKSFSRALQCQAANEYDSVKYITVNGKRKKVYIECKINCGNLGSQDIDGNIWGTIFNCDYVVYNPVFDAKTSTIFDSVVLERDEFLNILIRHNKFRIKKCSGKMCEIKKAGGEWYYDRVGIQSYRNGKDGGAAFIDDIMFSGMSVQDFCEIYKISTVK